MEPSRELGFGNGGQAFSGTDGSLCTRGIEDAGQHLHQQLSQLHLNGTEEILDTLDPWWDMPDLEHDWSPCPLGRAIFGPIVDMQYRECKCYLLTTLMFYKIAELYGCEVEVFGKLWGAVFSWLLEMEIM